MRSYWLTCSVGTVEVETDDAGRVTKAPALVRKFKAQPIEALQKWMSKYAGYQCRLLRDQSDLFSATQTETGEAG